MSVFVPNIINCYLPGFGFSQFTLNYLRIFPKSNLRLSNISPDIFLQELSVLSSAKLYTSDFETKESISLMNMLNIKGPRINPCGIPQVISHQSLKLESIFVLCFWLLRYSLEKCKLVSSRPYAPNLVNHDKYSHTLLINP